MKTISLSLAISNETRQTLTTQNTFETNGFEEEDGLSVDSSCEVSSNPIAEQLLRFEYHVLYHISYAVPYLCFNAYKCSKL